MNGATINLSSPCNRIPGWEEWHKLVRLIDLRSPCRFQATSSAATAPRSLCWLASGTATWTCRNATRRGTPCRGASLYACGRYPPPPSSPESGFFRLVRVAVLVAGFSCLGECTICCSCCCNTAFILQYRLNTAEKVWRGRGDPPLR